MLSVSILSVLIIMLVPKFSRRIPGSLVAIILVTAGVYALKTCLGIEGIDTIGDRFTIASQLPKAEMLGAGLGGGEEPFPDCRDHCGPRSHRVASFRDCG